jgi:hypothetical protein
MYLKIINSEDFLGFYKSDRDTEIFLPYLQNIYSINENLITFLLI